MRRKWTGSANEELVELLLILLAFPVDLGHTANFVVIRRSLSGDSFFFFLFLKVLYRVYKFQIFVYLNTSFFSTCNLFLL